MDRTGLQVEVGVVYLKPRRICYSHSLVVLLQVKDSMVSSTVHGEHGSTNWLRPSLLSETTSGKSSEGKERVSCIYADFGGTQGVL